MQTKINFLNTLALAATLLMTASACNKMEEIQPESNTPTRSAREAGFDLGAHGFDPDLFASKIEARLTGKVPGYGYALWVNGQPYTNVKGAGGKARYPVDAPALDYAPTTRQEVASSTKFVVALTVLRLLERNGKNTSELVWPYLPAYFKPHPDFKKLRFIDLLSHTSGVKQYPSPNVQKGELNSIQLSVENGIELNELQTITYDYENMNYGVLRLTVPYLIGKLENPACASTLKQLETDYPKLNVMVADLFIQAVRDIVMKPAGIAQWAAVDFKDWGGPVNQMTKYYSGNNTSQSGNDNPSNALDPGAGGLVISASELVQVVAKARQGKIVSLATFQQMKSGKIGMYQLGFDNNIIGEYGSYYHKNGGSPNVNSVLMDFQGKSNNESAVNVQLVITTNSNGTDVANPNVWAALFDASWK